MVNKEDLSKIKNMNDAQLKELIKQIAIASGANEKQIEGALSDMSAIRNAASLLSQNDINRLLENIGEENAKKIADIISK